MLGRGNEVGRREIPMGLTVVVGSSIGLRYHDIRNHTFQGLNLIIFLILQNTYEVSTGT